jgi:pimeloyl-ACP methyl ester carboxylesterase
MPLIATQASPALHYTISGSGPALLLLHGFPENSSIWEGVIPALSRSFTVVAPDMPGSGLTPLTHGSSIADMAEAVADIIRHLGTGPAVVAGHSMGGYIAFQLAATHPGLLAGLAAIHSFPLADDDEKKTNRRKAINIIRNGGKEAFIRQMVTNLFSTRFREDNPLSVEARVRAGIGMTDESLINYYEAMIGRNDNSAILPSLPFPIQWILGVEDNILPVSKILQSSYRASVNFVSLYNACGHISMLEQPAQLAADLASFAGLCHANSRLS